MSKTPQHAFINGKIITVDKLNERPEISVSNLTWDRIARLTYIDLLNITT